MMEEKIKNFLEKETGSKISNYKDNLIALGILDSFSMFKFIDFLEKEFEVEFDVENLSPENFNSVSSAAEFVKNSSTSSL